MDAKKILSFIADVTANNNREWFAEHKDAYLAMKNEIDQFTAQWIERMIEIEPEVEGLQPKDCVYRIYRDIRFSYDKRPYKHWQGILIAKKGGRKSPYACYYLHFEPGDCMFCGGVWNPESDLLKALRQDVFDNAEELEEIFARPEVKKYFTDFSGDEPLKRVPAPFPADWEHADWLKHKMYTFCYPFTEKEMCAPDFLDKLMDVCKGAKPLNDFLNYTIDENA